jgi:hypothetical protein
MQLFLHRLQPSVEDRDHLIDGGEKELEHDGRRMEVILLELCRAINEMPPSLLERGGVSVPDSHNPPPSAQEVGLDDISRRFGQPRHHPQPVLANRHPGDLAEAQRPRDVGGVETQLREHFRPDCLIAGEHIEPEKLEWCDEVAAVLTTWRTPTASAIKAALVVRRCENLSPTAPGGSGRAHPRSALPRSQPPLMVLLVFHGRRPFNYPIIFFEILSWTGAEG